MGKAMEIKVTCNSEERNHLEEHLSRFLYLSTIALMRPTFLC